MGASSVTGVGQGSADKAGQKGSEHLFLGVEKLIGTRIVLSGVATFSSATTAIVVLPQLLPGNWNATFVQTENSPADTVPPVVSDYGVLITPYTPGAASHVFSVINMTNTYTTSASTGGSNQGFTIQASTSQTATSVFWAIIRFSNSSVNTFPTHN